MYFSSVPTHFPGRDHYEEYLHLQILGMKMEEIYIFWTTVFQKQTLASKLGRIRHGCPGIDKKTQLLTRKVLHGCPRRLRPPALKLFCTQSSHGKMGKAAPWTLAIISHWSADKLSSIYYLLLDRRELYFTNSAQNSGGVCLLRPPVPTSHALESPRVPESRRPRVPRPRFPSPRPHVPASPRPTSPCPRLPTSPRPRVPASPRPRVLTSPRPTVPRPHVPESQVPRPSPQVPVPLLVTALLDPIVNSYRFRFNIQR